MSETQGTYNCPICAWPEPHSHDATELTARPQIDGCRASFEVYVQEFVTKDRLMWSQAKGMMWDFPALHARDHQERGWARRCTPTGSYEEQLVEALWQFWRVSWMAARGR